MKRIVLFALLLVILSIMPAYAVERGELVTISITITENPNNAVSARLWLAFNNAYLEFVSAESSREDVIVLPSANANEKFGLLDLNGIAVGEVATVTFRVSKHARCDMESPYYGSFPIDVVVDSAYGANKQEVLLTVVGGQVTVDHNWTPWEVTSEQTCTTPYSASRRCTWCGNGQGVGSPALGHKEGYPVVLEHATCLKEGQQEICCLNCCELLRTEVIPAFGHKDGDTVVIKEPSETETGIQVVQCANCGKTIRTESVPATGVARLPGDANDDGMVDIFDALLILQYDVGWEVVINVGNADVNADAMVNIFDALLILQYDVGWDVTLQ